MGMLLPLALLAILVAAPSRAAAPSAEVARARHVSERNQLGLLRFCVDQGLVEADIARLRRRALEALGPQAASLGEAEEAAGRGGQIAFATSRASFADDAKGQGISLRYSCEQVARRVTRLASP